MKRSLSLLIAFFAATVLAQAPVSPPQIFPINIDEFRKLPLSGVPFFSTLRVFNALPVKATAQPSDGIDMSVSPSDVASVERTASRRSPVPDAIVTPSVNLSNDAAQDVEPSVITQSTLTTTTYTNLSGAHPRNRFITTDASRVVVGAGELPMPRIADGWAGSSDAGYQQTADPLMAKNSSTGRVYATGIAHSGVAFTAPSGIGLWLSDDGGRTWPTPPSPVASGNFNGQFYDKPSIAVSQHSGSPGYVYVAYTLLTSQFAGSQQIHVARSTDSGLTFPQDRCIVRDVFGGCTTENVSASQIMVDPASGYIYTFWIDYGRSELRRATSTDFGNTWSAPETVAGGRNFLTINDVLNGSLHAASVLMARFNSTARRLTVVWHERESAASGRTDVFFASKGAGESWDIRLAPVTTLNDQFMPALDFDPFGGVLVTYYTRREDGGNFAYRMDDVLVDGRGNVIRGEERVSTFPSNPPSGGPFPGFIGDYQDVWYDSAADRYNSAWIGQDVNVDVWLTGLR